MSFTSSYSFCVRFLPAATGKIFAQFGFGHQVVKVNRWQLCRSWSSTNAADRWTLDDIAKRILDEKTNQVVVMAGAGISTPSGIPDFRTPGTGLYDNLHQYKLPYAEAIFDLHYFMMDQRPFFALARELYPGKYRPNISHYFVRLLQEKGKLLRMYTQNIDGLERVAGIEPQALIEAHGTFVRATCTYCSEKVDGEKIKGKIFGGEIPRCSIPKCKGIFKPDIVFFGEQLPTRFWNHVNDMPAANLLIVMGTSLEVEPFASIADHVLQNTPRLLINRDVVGSFVHGGRPKDVVQEGDLIESIKQLVEKLGWTSELNDLISKYEEKPSRSEKDNGRKSQNTP